MILRRAKPERQKLLIKARIAVEGGESLGRKARYKEILQVKCDSAGVFGRDAQS